MIRIFLGKVSEYLKYLLRRAQFHGDFVLQIQMSHLYSEVTFVVCITVRALGTPTHVILTDNGPGRRKTMLKVHVAILISCLSHTQEFCC